MGGREKWCLLPASWNKCTCKNRQSRLGPEEFWLISEGDSAIPMSSLHKMQEPARPLSSRPAWLLFPLLFTLGVRAGQLILGLLEGREPVAECDKKAWKPEEESSE